MPDSTADSRGYPGTGDLAWEALYDVLLLGLDILTLFDAELDGIEDPQSDPNKKIDISDYRPQALFTTFAVQRHP